MTTTKAEVNIDEHLKVQAERDEVTASLDALGLFAASDREADEQLYQLGNKVKAVATPDEFEPSRGDPRPSAPTPQLSK